MKHFSKTIPSRHQLSREMKELYGWEGYGHLTCLLELADDIGFFELTTKVLSNEFGMRMPKAEKVLSDYKRIFEQSYRITRQSKRITPDYEHNTDVLPGNTSLLQDNTELIGSYYGVTEGQNPHGSTRVLEKSKEEKSKENISENGPENIELKKSIELACGYASSSLNNQAAHWVHPYLKSFFVLNRSKWETLKDSDISYCWEMACKYWDKGKRYVQKVFEQQLQDFDPSKIISAPVPKPKILSRKESLMAAKQIKNRWNGDVVDTSTIQIDNHGTITFKESGWFFPWEEYEPIEEVG